MGNLVQFFIRKLDGKRLTLEMDLDTKVENLKNKIYEIEKIGTADQRLIYGGKQLEDGNTLNDYGVQRDSTINLVLRLRGGL